MFKNQQKLKNQPSMVVHISNPSYLEDRDRRIVVQGHTRQKVNQTLSQKQAA
jgi:hypothetical protein